MIGRFQRGSVFAHRFIQNSKLIDQALSLARSRPSQVLQQVLDDKVKYQECFTSAFDISSKTRARSSRFFPSARLVGQGGGAIEASI